MNITEFSVKNYQFTLIMFIMVAVVGVVTLLTMPRAEDPIIKTPFYNIVAVYPGTSPKDMEELVVKPIENKLHELDNLVEINTTIEDGLVIISAEFKYGINTDNKFQEVVRDVNGLRNELPDELYSLEITNYNPSDVNILQAAFISETAPLATMEKYASELKDRLEKVSDLKKVKISGIEDDIIRIDLQLDKLAQLKIPINSVLGSIQSNAVIIPGGSVNLGNKTFNIKTSGKYKSIDEINETVIYNANGRIVYLKDVAEVSFRNPLENHITRLNGYRCILINAAQKEGGNINKTHDLYHPIIEEFATTLPENIKLVRHFDQADNVTKRLSGLGIDFLIAILLVLLTLLPLGARASFVVMITIPLSLALGLVGLNLFGISINQISIVGMVVALGLVVDDAIVVVENIERWLREGYTLKDSVIKATRQITIAVIGTTATLVIAFMPMVFLPGASGQFVRGLPMVITFSIIASSLLSLTLVPFLASRLLSKNHSPAGNVFLRILKRGIHNTYSRFMHVALGRPVTTLLISLFVFIGSMGLFPILGFKLFPTSEKPIFLINIRLPQQTSIMESSKVAMMVEDSLLKKPQIKYFTTNVGKGNPQIYYNVTQQREKIDFVQLFVQLHDDTEYQEKRDLIQEIRKQFKDFPYAKVEVQDFEQGPPVEAPISIRIFGDNLDTLRKLSYQVEDILRSNSQTVYVNNELNTLKTDLKFNLNKEKARTLGISTSDIDRTIRLAVAGLQVGTYTNQDGDDYDIIVNAPRERFPNLDVFDNLFVNNAMGTPVPITQIATVGFEASPTIINHHNKNRFAKITSFTKGNVLANDVLKDVVPKLDEIKMPKGYSYKLAGEVKNEGDAFGGGFMNVILITVFLFIAVLILQFKTFKGILIVLSVIPLGMIGGLTMLWLSGNPMQFIAIIGFIGLAGIEVKNSILLVDFTNQLRQQGVALNEAIEKAGEIRFLPVVLTSLTAIGGLIPLAIYPNPLISPLAIVLIGGLISSTILSRIVTPVMYKIIPPKVEILD